MKNFPARLTLAAVLGSLLITIQPVLAQGTAFTYQGRFNDNGIPANATVEFQLTLWNALTGGSQVAAASPATSIVTVTNGLFTVAVDFGTAAFDGSDRYLQMEARTTIGPFTLLTPRQKITATPYALLAGKLTGNGLAGTYGNAVTFSNAANVFNGAFTGNGAGLSNLNATSLGGLNASSFWKIGGNPGTIADVNFLGTTDNQPLELRVNGQRTLRLEPITVTNAFPGATIIYSNAPNVIGGASPNGVGAGVVGAFIGGGGVGGIYADQGAGYVFYGAFTNFIGADLSAIVGGNLNVIQTNADGSIIGGGSGNTIQNGSGYGVIVGGSGNTMTNAYAATIGGGSDNSIETVGNFTTIAGGVDNTIAADAPSATIGGGNDNTNRASTGTIGGGSRNLIGTSGSSATVSGGSENTAGGANATVPGGSRNSAVGNYSFAAGQRAKANHQGTFLWADSQNADFASAANNQFLIRAASGVGIGTAVTPNGALHQHSGGLAITGASSPYTGAGAGVFIETGGGIGQIFAFDYTPFSPLPLILNAPGGNVGIGRTPAANKLEVEGNASKTVAGSWVANSDARIKTDVQTVTGALDKLAQVRLVQFRYTDDYRAKHPSIENRSYLNVIAQEFQQIFPESVKYGGDQLPNGQEILQVDTYPLTIYSAAAVQELDGTVKELKKEMKRRDAENAALKRELEKLKQVVDTLANAKN